MFIEIDFENWERKEMYGALGPSTFYVTAEVDVTDFLACVKENSFNFYAAVNFVVAKIANENMEYRYAIVDGKIGYWDKVDVLYTLMRKNTNHLFTHKAAKYEADYRVFEKGFLEGKARAENCDQLYCDQPVPRNVITTSIMPNVSFTGLAFVYQPAESGHLAPFVTWGKYFETDGKTKMPVSIEFHHEVNDGWHAEQFFLKMQAECDGFRKLICGQNA